MKNRKVRTSFPFLSFPLIILPFPLYDPYVLKSDTIGLSRTGARFRISWLSIVSGSPLISPNENETCAPPSALRNNNSSIPNSSSFSISQVPEKFSENLSRSKVLYPACELMPKGIIEINSKIDEDFDLKVMALGELFCCIVKLQCFIFELGDSQEDAMCPTSYVRQQVLPAAHATTSLGRVLGHSAPKMPCARRPVGLHWRARAGASGTFWLAAKTPQAKTSR